MITVQRCQDALKFIGYKWGNIYVPEYTWNGQRVDAIIVDIKTRWIRGYEIKVNRSDFLRDEKWQFYSQFLSSLSIVCPEGLIEKKEIPDPFGLMYVTEISHQWIKRPKNFQKRGGLAWTWTYLDVLEKEMPRMQLEINQLTDDIKRLKRNQQFNNKYVVENIPCLSE